MGTRRAVEAQACIARTPNGGGARLLVLVDVSLAGAIFQGAVCGITVQSDSGFLVLSSGNVLAALLGASGRLVGVVIPRDGVLVL